MFKSYAIDSKIIDKPTFFRSLAKYFPDATTFYGGGPGLPVEVRATYETHEDEGMYIPPSQTQWAYRCVFSQGLMEDLAGLSEKYSFGEILKQLYLYKGTEPLLLWHDVLIDTKASISDSVPEKTVSAFARELGLKYRGPTKDDCCVCVRLPDIAVLLMGDYRIYWEISETLEEVKRRGKPYDWLSANKCRQCGQWWLGAQEEHNDVWCLRRLNQETAYRLLGENLWPPDFEDYSTLLRYGQEAGVFVSYLDPADSFLDLHMALLARQKPGISVSELAQSLNLDTLTATMLGEKVVREKGVSITFDKGLLDEEVHARIKRNSKRLASSSKAVQEMNNVANRPSRSLTTDEALLLERIQQIYGNQNSLDKCVMTDEGDIAILVTNTYGRSVITVNLTFVADISREQNLTEEGIEAWLKP